MATSLLRLSRLASVKCLLRDGWITPRTQFVAPLCTKGDVPPKTPKKAKASSKTIEADERASLLAYKPAVAFPSKLSDTGFILKDVALGETETAEVVSTAAVNETTTDSPVAETAAADIAIEEAKITDGATTEDEGSKILDVKAEVRKDQDDTSSSSSSDSDSDSDSDDEKPKTETPVQSAEKAAEEKKAPGLTTEEVGVKDKEAKPETTSFAEAQESAENVAKETPEEVPAPSAKPIGSVETLIDPAPVLSSMTEAIPDVSSESITVAAPDNMVDTAPVIKTTPTEESPVEEQPENKVEETVKVSAEVVPEETTEAKPEEVADVAVNASPEVSTEVSTGAPGDVAAPKAEAETLPVPSEELVDPAPVTTDAVEALEQAPKEAPEPEPEPFDNTTYKNLQHHHYTEFTFADLDVEMAKHRLPQPSAGRH